METAEAATAEWLQVPAWQQSKAMNEFEVSWLCLKQCNTRNVAAAAAHSCDLLTQY
jgi:hypothetical protein